MKTANLRMISISNFEQWISNITGSIIPGGNYEKEMEFFFILFQRFIDGESVSDDNKVFREKLIGDSMSSIVTSFMKLPRLPESELNKVVSILQKFSYLLSCGVKKGIFIFCDYILRIYSYDSIFFSKNDVRIEHSRPVPCKVLFTQFVQYFMNDILPMIEEFILSSNSQDCFIVFVFLFKLFNMFNGIMAKNRVDEFFISTKNQVLHHLNTFNSSNVREADPQSIWVFANGLISFITSPEKNGDVVSSLLVFSNHFLRSQFLDKQVIGARIIDQCSSNTLMSSIFIEWAINSSFSEFVLESDLHSKVLSILIDPITKYSSQKPISATRIKSVWSRIEALHSSDRPVLRRLIASVLRASGVSISKEFISESINDEIASSDKITFLVELVYNSDIDQNTILSVVQYVFLQINKGSIVIDKALTSVLFETKHSHIQSALFQYFLSKLSCSSLDNAEQEGFTSLIRYLINLPQKIENQLFNIIMANLKDVSRHDIDYHFVLLNNLVSHSSNIKIFQKQLIEIIPSFFSSINGILSLTKLISDRGLELFDESTYAAIFVFIRAFPLEKIDKLTVKCLYHSYIGYNIICKNISNESHVKSLPMNKYQLLRFPTNGITELISITLRCNEEISKSFIRLFEKVFYQGPPSFIVSFIEKISIGIKEFPNDSTPKERLIRLLHRMCTMLYLISGANSEETHSSMPFVSPITVSFLIKEKEQLNLYVDQNWCKDSLIYYLASKLKQNHKSFYLRSSDNLIGKSKELKLYLKPGSQISIVGLQSMSSEYTRIVPFETSDIFELNGTINFIYNLLNDNDNPKLNESAYNLLCLLKTPKFIKEQTTSGLLAIIKSKATNPFHVRYILHEAVRRSDFYEKQGLQILISIIINQNFSSMFLESVFENFPAEYQFSENDEVNQLIPKLLNVYFYSVPHQTTNIKIMLQQAAKFSPFEFYSIFVSQNYLIKAINENNIGFIERVSFVIESVSEIKDQLLIDCLTFLSQFPCSSVLLLLCTSLITMDSDVSTLYPLCLHIIGESNNSSFVFACKLLSKINQTNPSKSFSNDFIVLSLLKSLPYIDDSEKQSSLIGLISTYTSIDKGLNSIIEDSFSELFNINCERWGYDTSINVKSVTGYSGLRNLGATCYMNSTLQCLYWIHEFQKFVVTSDFSLEWQKQLQRLFYYMNYSRLPSVDTSFFAQNWRFYDNEALNVRMQQDAVEFVQIFLDRFDSCGSAPLFKGKLVNKIVTLDGIPVSESTEPFHTFSLEVKNCNNFQDSFNVFIQKEILNGYNSEDMGKIDVFRFVRIREAPNFFIVQLKRFEYDVQTWQRIKISSKYEFPNTFDLSPCLEDPSKPLIYNLTGIVLHSGNAQGGHYTSIIKINDKWVKFNDESVSFASESQIKESYGSGSFNTNEVLSSDIEAEMFNPTDTVPTAYLLFYSLGQNTNTGNHMKNNHIIDEINQSNRDHAKLQTIFSLPIVSFMKQTSNIDLLLKYFFKVFSHSKNVSVGTELVDHTLRTIAEQNKYDYTMQWMLHNLLIIDSILTECTTESILSSSLKFIEAVLCQSNINNGLSFVNHLIEKISELSKLWRAIPNYLNLVFAFSEYDESHTDLFIKGEYHIKLFQVATKLIQESKSSVFVQNANFSSIFVFLLKHLSLLSENLFETLLSSVSVFAHSSINSDPFIELLKKGVETGYIQKQVMYESIINSSKDPSSSIIVSLFFQMFIQAKSKEEIQALAPLFINSPKVSKESLVNETNSEVRRHPKDPLKINCLKYGAQVFFYLATCDDAAARGAMEPTYLGFFPGIDGLLNYSRCEGALPGAKECNKFSWNESSNKRIATGDDKVSMVSFLIDTIEALDSVNKNPKTVLSGRDGNFRLCIMLRVILYMISRTENSLPRRGWEILIQLLYTLHEQNIPNDANLIELIRVFRVFKFDENQSFFEVHYGRIVEIMFSTYGNNTELLNDGRVVCFIEGLKNFFKLNEKYVETFLKCKYLPDVIESILKSRAESALILLNFLNEYKNIAEVKKFIVEVLLPRSSTILMISPSAGSLLFKLSKETIPQNSLLGILNSGLQSFLLLSKSDSYSSSGTKKYLYEIHVLLKEASLEPTEEIHKTISETIPVLLVLSKDYFVKELELFLYSLSFLSYSIHQRLTNYCQNILETDYINTHPSYIVTIHSLLAQLYTNKWSTAEERVNYGIAALDLVINNISLLSKYSYHSFLSSLLEFIRIDGLEMHEVWFMTVYSMVLNEGRGIVEQIRFLSWAVEYLPEEFIKNLILDFKNGSVSSDSSRTSYMGYLMGAICTLDQKYIDFAIKDLGLTDIKKTMNESYTVQESLKGHPSTDPDPEFDEFLY